VSWIRRLWNVVGGDVDPDIDEELQFHIDQRICDNIARGMNPEQARLDAMRRFGSRAGASEQTRDADVLVTLETIARDGAFALRSLRKQPAFTLVAVLTLALGIGANAAVFTVVRGVLLQPLPFTRADQLVIVTYQPEGSGYWLYPGLSDRHYVALREWNRPFTATATFATVPVTLTGAGDPVRLASATVTPDFFRVLLVNAAVGRTFLPEDAVIARDPVVVLGDDLWRSRFGAEPRMIGRRIALDGVAHTVIGILPPHFSYPADAQLWTPLAVREEPGMSFTRPVLARLRPELTRREAQAAWDTFAGGLPLDSGSKRHEWSARILPLEQAIVGDVRRPLLIFTGAVALVLLIAWANVSNLFLVHTVARRQEIAIRLALGAARARVVRQLLTQSAMVGLAGGVAAMLITLISVPALLALVPPGRLPRAAEIHVDAAVLAFTAGLALVSGLVLGLVPAFHGTHRAAFGAWRESTTWSTRRSDRFRHALAVAEVALALVLLVGAGLLVRSFLRLNTVRPGFLPGHVMTMTVDLPGSKYATAAGLHAFHTRLLGSLTALPHVIAAGAVNWLPLGDMLIRGDVILSRGREARPGFQVTKAAVSPGYLRAMGITLTRGRDFTDRDHDGAAGVVIVSRSVARRLWPHEDALGQQLAVESRPTRADWLTVVGIVDDIRQIDLKQDVVPAVYQPYLQVSQPFFLTRMTFVVRTDAEPRAVATMMQTALHAADGNLAPHSIRSMREVIADTIAEPRLQTGLLGVFSTVALLLAAIGVYGVLAASVADRRREIGIRIALGAGRTELVGMVLRRVLFLTATGLTFGIAGALAVSRVLAGLLFEITPTDSVTFLGAAAVLGGVALLAALLPAMRASAVDPVRALRAE
jgi:predicted permease